MRIGVLLTPDGSRIEVEGRRVFGRADFESLRKSLRTGYVLYIARHHFAIFRDGESFYIEDLGGLNDTFSNGELMRGKGRRKLKDGDEICPASPLLRLKFRIVEAT